MSENELSSSNFEPDTKMEAEESRAVFVDTNLDTHLIVPIYSHSTVTSLKRRLRKEHLDCFPQLGRIEINALSVKLCGSYYRLPDYMLLKTAFRGVGDTWSVYADIWTQGSCLESHKYIECKPLETRPLHQIGSQHTNLSPQTHVSLDMSSGKMKRTKKKNKKKKKKKINDEGKVENNYSGAKEKSIEKTRQSWQLDVPRADEISATKQVDKPSKGHHYTSVLHPSVMFLKDSGDSIVKDLEKGAGMVPQLIGTSTKLPEVLNKESGIDIDTSVPIPRVKKSKKKKMSNIGVNERPAATFDQEPDILLKADAPADNTIYKTGSIKFADEVSPLQPKNVSELLLQHDSLTLEKEIVEDVAPLKSDNAAKKKKKKRGRSGQEITAEKATPMHLSNVPELLLPQEKSLNLVDREKEIEEDIAPAKRKKSNKSNSSGTENQELLSKSQIDDQKEDDVRNCLPYDFSRPEKCVETISETPQTRSQNEKDVLVKNPHEEVQKLEAPPLKSENPAKRKKSNKSKSGTENQEPLSKRQIDDQKQDDMRNCLPDDISRPEKCVETISETPQKTFQNEKAVLGNDPHEEVQKLEAPRTVIQSEKSKKLSHKKQPAPAVDPPSLPVDQHFDAPIKVDDNLTTCNTIVDGGLLKSDKSAKKRITNGSEQEHKTAAKVSQPHLNIAPELSRDESVNFANRTKEIEENVSPTKSEHTMKKRKQRRDSQKKKKENDVLTENYDLSSKKQSDIDKPEESVDTMSKSLKRSLNEEAISSRVPPGSSLKEKPDVETRERAVPKTVIDSNVPLRRSQRKLSVSGKDLSSLPVNHKSADKKMDVDAPKSVEEADDPPTSHNDGANNQKKMIQVEGHHDDSKEIPSLAASDVFTESSHLASKQKAKKNDQPSAVDPSSNGQKIAESKKNRGHAKTSELQKPSTVQGHEKSESPLADILVSVADPIKTNKKAGVSCASVDDGSRISGKKKLTETVAPKRVDQADDLFTDAESIGAQEHKEVIQDDEHHGEFSQAPQIEVSTVLAEATQLEKPKASVQKAKKVDQPRIDTSSNGRDLLGFKKNKGSAKTSELQKPITDQKHDKSISPLSIKNSKVLNEVNTTVADPTNISRNGGVSRASVDGGSKSSDAVKKPLVGGKAKDPPKRLEENSVDLGKSSLSKTKQLKKRLPSRTIFDDESSSSSDDEDRNDTLSSSATLPPDNLSSSDYSEGESEGVVISQPDPSNDNERSKANSSGSKLGSILRSSSRYKKAKLVAVQSQDDDSQIPEFVPDSLPDV